MGGFPWATLLGPAVSLLAGGMSQPPPPPPRPLYQLNTVPDAQFAQQLSQNLDPLQQQTSADVKNFMTNMASDFTPAALKGSVSGDLTGLTNQQVGKYANVANMIPTAINTATKQALMNRKMDSDRAMQRSIDLQNAQISRQNELENWQYVHNRPNPFLGFIQNVAGALPGILAGGNSVGSGMSTGVSAGIGLGFG